MKKKLKSDSPLCAATCSPSSLTPESDSAYESFEDATNEVLRHFVDYEVARKLEMERDNYRARSDVNVRDWRRECLKSQDLQNEIRRLHGAINSALMHLETNYDIDGASMKDSDAARTLRSVISLEND